MDFTDTNLVTAMARTGELRNARPAVVASVPNANTLIVDVDNVRITVACLVGTYAVGDTVLVLRDGRTWFALGRIGPTSQPAPEAPNPDTKPAPPEPPQQVTKTFLPQSTGTRRGSSWRTDTTDLYQGDWTGRGRNFGAAFYGNGPASLSGEAVSGYVILRRLSGGSYSSQSPTLVLLDQKVRPSGTPTIDATTVATAIGIGSTIKFWLAASWIQAFIDGTSGGLGIWVNADSPYVHLAGRVSYSAAMALTITYLRG